MMKTTFAAGVLCLLAVGCTERTNSRGQTEHHAHEHELQTAQITRWTNGFEVFAEHTAPVVGEPAEFITHVSILATGEPRRAGPIDYVFRQGEEVFRHSQDAPNRDGIYIPAVIFPRTGAWEAELIIDGEEAPPIEMGTIQVYADAHGAAHAEFPAPPDGIPFLKEQQWRITSRVAPVGFRELTERIPLPVKVVLPPGADAMVRSPVKGTLQRGGAAIARIGERVEAGDVIASIEPIYTEFTTKLIEAEADAIRTKAALQQAEAAYERTKNLAEQKARSLRELQEAEAAFLSARAAFQAAAGVQEVYRNSGAKFADGGVVWEVKAPISGFIEQVRAGIGEQVSAEQELYRIVNSDVAYLEARLPEFDLQSIRPRSGSVLELFGRLEPRLLGEEARLVAIGKVIDSVTRTVPLTYEVSNTDRSLFPGAMGVLRVATAASTNVPALPSGAIVEEDGVPVAFVQVSGETFQKRDLQLGVKDGDWVEIKRGIEPGEHVVIEGAYPILLSTKMGAIPAHGHVH